MVCLAGFEPTTTSLEGRCSIQLSYRHKTEDPALEANTSSDKGKGISTNSRLKFQGIKSPPPRRRVVFLSAASHFPSGGMILSSENLLGVTDSLIIAP